MYPGDPVETTPEKPTARTCLSGQKGRCASRAGVNSRITRPRRRRPRAAWAAAGPLGAMRSPRSFSRGFKVPRSSDYEEELPGLPTGKLYRRLLRARDWGKKDSRIV